MSRCHHGWVAGSLCNPRVSRALNDQLDTNLNTSRSPQEALLESRKTLERYFRWYLAAFAVTSLLPMLHLPSPGDHLRRADDLSSCRFIFHPHSPPDLGRTFVYPQLLQTRTVISRFLSHYAIIYGESKSLCFNLRQLTQ